MSYQSIPRRKAPRRKALRIHFLLPLLLLLSGCGLTGSNKLADSEQPEAIVDVIAKASVPSQSDPAATTETTAAETTATGAPHSQATIAAATGNRISQRALYPQPDEASIDVASIPLTPVMPVSSRANVLKKETLPPNPSGTSAPAPEEREQPPRISDAPSALSPPAPVAATQLSPRAPGKVDKIDSDSFQQAVLESEIPVLVDFYADWCGPCRRLAPVLDQVAQEETGMRIVKINSDHNQKLAKKYRVGSLPTAILFIDGAPAAHYVGQDKIQKALGR